jgi:hypothetical protein
MVRRGSVMVRCGSGMVRHGSVMVQHGSVIVRHGSVVWCGVAQLWCGVAQLVPHQLAVMQARVRFWDRHHRELIRTEHTSDEEMEGASANGDRYKCIK